MDNNAMFAAQQAQYNRMYGGLDAATGRYNFDLNKVLTLLTE
jgi:hypothetical protein